MIYEKLNYVSKLVSKFYIQLHMKVGISHSFHWWSIVKYCKQVEDTYMYGYFKNSQQSCGIFEEENNKNIT